MFSIKFDKLSSIGANRCHYCTREMFMWLSGKVNKFSVCTIERKMSEVAVNTCVRLGGKHLWHLSLCNFFLFKKIACVFRVNSAQLSPPNTCVCVCDSPNFEHTTLSFKLQPLTMPRMQLNLIWVRGIVVRSSIRFRNELQLPATNTQKIEFSWKNK